MKIILCKLYSFKQNANSIVKIIIIMNIFVFLVFGIALINFVTNFTIPALLHGSQHELTIFQSNF